MKSKLILKNDNESLSFLNLYKKSNFQGCVLVESTLEKVVGEKSWTNTGMMLVQDLHGCVFSPVKWVGIPDDNVFSNRSIF